MRRESNSTYTLFVIIHNDHIITDLLLARILQYRLFIGSHITISISYWLIASYTQLLLTKQTNGIFKQILRMTWQQKRQYNF